MRIVCLSLALAFLHSALPAGSAHAGRPAAAMLRAYYEEMTAPQPFVVRTGEDLRVHQQTLRRRLLEAVGLSPLPERVPLDVSQSEPLDHRWCTVRRVRYQLWPGVYADGILYMPKDLAERPAPAMLSLTGHWDHGNANVDEQRRALNFARLGYVVFATAQYHFEDLPLGISHQTVLIWNNMRALDFLESLPEVDRSRIGAAGGSGGGLQCEMLLALDPRVKAGTIVGLTCDFREIMFPDSTHCRCNHFPGAMCFCDHPEISTLGMPAAVQYLTMNDWTRRFDKDNFPTIQKLYAAGGVPDRVTCRYFDTDHSYDRQKREATYGWIERWVHGRATADPITEPDDSMPFPPETLEALKTPPANDKGLAEISQIYSHRWHYEATTIGNPAEWQAYRDRMIATLRRLLGLETVLPQRAKAPEPTLQRQGELIVEQTAYPSEGPILVPTLLLRRHDAVNQKLPVVIVLSGAGKDVLVKQGGANSPAAMAKAGALVVLPDLRPYGEMFSIGEKDADQQTAAWERNGVVWGRPTPGMSYTDLRGVLDAVLARPDADPAQLSVVTRDSAGLAVTALFAAALDLRIVSADLDLTQSCFEKRNVPLVSNVLRHGDVLQWAALLADRKLTLRRLPVEAGDPQWLADVFAAVNNSSRFVAAPP